MNTPSASTGTTDRSSTAVDAQPLDSHSAASSHVNTSSDSKKYHFSSNSQPTPELNSKFRYDEPSNVTPNSAKYSFQPTQSVGASEDGRSDSAWVSSASAAASTLHDGSSKQTNSFLNDDNVSNNDSLGMNTTEKACIMSAISNYHVPTVDNNDAIESLLMDDGFDNMHDEYFPLDRTYMADDTMQDAGLHYKFDETMEERVAREAGEEKMKRLNQQHKMTSTQSTTSSMYGPPIDASLVEPDLEKVDSNLMVTSDSDDDHAATENSEGDEFEVDRSEFPDEFDCDINIKLNKDFHSEDSETTSMTDNSRRSINRRNSDVLSSGPVNMSTPKGNLLFLGNVVTTVGEDGEDEDDEEVNSHYDIEESGVEESGFTREQSSIGLVQEDEEEMDMESGPVNFTNSAYYSQGDRVDEGELEYDDKGQKKKKEIQPEAGPPREDRCCSASECVIM